MPLDNFVTVILTAVAGPQFVLCRDETGMSQYQCVWCGRGYKHKHSLWTHQRYECGKEPSFQCRFCPYKAKLKGNLQKHMTGQHLVDTHAFQQTVASHKSPKTIK